MAKWFHTRLKQAREQAGLSQLELAAELGVSGATISNWENRLAAPRGPQHEGVIAWIEQHEASGSAPSTKMNGSTPGNGQKNSRRSGSNALMSLERIYEDWPQSRIAEALSVSQATISNWLRTGVVNEKYTEALKQLETELAKEKANRGETAVRIEKAQEQEPRYGDWLRSELEQRGLNAVQLAERSGVHVNTILGLLEGRTEKPQQRTRRRIEKVVKPEATAASARAEEQDTWYYIGLEWTQDEIAQVPNEPGVYIIHDRLGRPAYVGVAYRGSGGIRARLRKHNELRWTADRRVAHSFSYALATRMPRNDPSELAKALEKLLIKFMGNAILINEKDVENLAG